MAAVFCPCREPGSLEQSSIPTLLETEECWFPPNNLLYCPSCRVIRCPYCTTKEPMMWFCSHCLMESTKTGAQESSNLCMRNCLRCPRCSRNAISKQKSPNLVQVNCSLCDYEYKLHKDSRYTLAAQVKSSRDKRFNAIKRAIRLQFAEKPGTNRKHRSPPVDLTEEANSHNESSELPSLVPLRAKYSKQCRSCGTVLAKPVKHPGQATYETLSTARAILPAFEIHSVEGKYYLLGWNPSDKPMHVTIANLDADSVLAEEISIPSKGSGGFPAPLFLVVRESPESRQAFMAGLKTAKSGPGWALQPLSLTSTSPFLTLYTSTKVGEGHNVGAWMRVPVINR